MIHFNSVPMVSYLYHAELSNNLKLKFSCVFWSNFLFYSSTYTVWSTSNPRIVPSFWIRLWHLKIAYRTYYILHSLYFLLHVEIWAKFHANRWGVLPSHVQSMQCPHDDLSPAQKIYIEDNLKSLKSGLLIDSSVLCRTTPSVPKYMYCCLHFKILLLQ